MARFVGVKNSQVVFVIDYEFEDVTGVEIIVAPSSMETLTPEVLAENFVAWRSQLIERGTMLPLKMLRLALVGYSPTDIKDIDIISTDYRNYNKINLHTVDSIKKFEPDFVLVKFNSSFKLRDWLTFVSSLSKFKLLSEFEQYQEDLRIECLTPFIIARSNEEKDFLQQRIESKILVTPKENRWLILASPELY